MRPDPYAAPEAAPPPAHPGKLAVIEWIGSAAAVLMIMLTMTFAMPVWRTMFREFGSLDDLPLLTRIVLVPWSIPVITLPAVAAIAMALRALRRPAQRRRWILAAVILACLGLAVCVVATRLPSFMVAEKIQAE